MKLTSIPNQHATKVVDFPRLDGGLNLWELDYRISNNQSPEMKNLWWQDGVLQCRDGQEYLVEPAAELPGPGRTCAPELYWGHLFYHCGTKMYCLDMRVTPAQGEHRVPRVVYTALPEDERGTFFRYNEIGRAHV